jgi:RNA polymerase sigma-70 factor, ECF subfamily
MRSRASITPVEWFPGESVALSEVSAEEQERQVAAEIAARIGRGDRSAEDAMVRRYGAGLLYLLKRRTRDAQLALDLRQDAFQVALEKLRSSRLEEPERLGAYLRGIALNLWIAQQRKNVRRATEVDSDAVEAAADDGGGPFADVSREQVREAVGVLLSELPTARDREILTRLYLRDEDKSAICAALGVDAEHFNRVLFRAKQRFRELVLRTDGKVGLRLVGTAGHG